MIWHSYLRRKTEKYRKKKIWYSAAFEKRVCPSMHDTLILYVPPTLYILAAIFRNDRFRWVPRNCRLFAYIPMTVLVTSNNSGPVQSPPDDRSWSRHFSGPLLSSSSFHTWRHSSFGNIRFSLQNTLWWCPSKNPPIQGVKLYLSTISISLHSH